jgi:2-C-methyl-D-erythritol 2,4-cyclodiphosphate synthase
MKKRIAELLKATPEQVNVKATTTEKLGFTGRGEGIASQAVVLLKKKEL